MAYDRAVTTDRAVHRVDPRDRKPVDVVALNIRPVTFRFHVENVPGSVTLLLAGLKPCPTGA